MRLNKKLHGNRRHFSRIARVIFSIPLVIGLLLFLSSNHQQDLKLSRNDTSHFDDKKMIYNDELVERKFLNSRELNHSLNILNSTDLHALNVVLTIALIFLVGFGLVLWVGLNQVGRNLKNYQYSSLLDVEKLSEGVCGSSLLRGLMLRVTQLTFQHELELQRRIQKLEFDTSLLELLASSTSDGLILLQGNQLLYANFMGKSLLGMSSGMALNCVYPDFTDDQGLNSIMIHSMKKAISQSMPIQYEFREGDRKSEFLIHAYLMSAQEISDNSVIKPLRVWNETQALDPIYLIRAQDVNLLREVQEAKTHFLGTLSHEVKTPVTSLTMAIRLLQRAKESFMNPMHQNLIEICVKDIDRLRQLIDEFMGVSELDSLSQNIRFQKVEFIKLMRHSVQSFMNQARDKSIELSFLSEGSCTPLILELDAVKISWVLSKLLNNAIRHTPRGGKVDVCVEACEDWVDIRIQDTGPGIERNRIESIFEKYSSYYDLRVGRSGSIGLSLAISKDVITAHGGMIEVKSECGTGSTFILRLPRKTQRIGAERGFAQEKSHLSHENKLDLGSSNMKGAQGGTDSCGG